MAAITATQGPSLRRQATAQATTGQTDWLDVPKWARYVQVFLSVSATAGTTPILTPSFLAADPISRDDGRVINVAEHAALTGITGAAEYVFEIGPGLTGIANDVTNAAAADSYVQINALLPALLGVKILNDRTTGDETYTYNLSVEFKA